MWWSQRHNFIEAPLRDLLDGDVWAAACAIDGDIVRAVPHRCTRRFEHKGSIYYIKQHFGVGWGELLKNWLTFKKPICSAINELRAACRLANAGVSSIRVCAFWRTGFSPASQKSFIISESISDGFVKLDYLLEGWDWKFPTLAVRHNLVRGVGSLAGAMFAAGVAHRDFYACHILVPLTWVEHPEGVPNLRLLDLHRAYCGTRTPTHLQVRDLGALRFSLWSLALSRTDYMRFARALCGDSWRICRDEIVCLQAAIEYRAQVIRRRGLS